MENTAYLRANASSVYANETQVIFSAAGLGDDLTSVYSDDPKPDGTIVHPETSHIHRFDFAETKPVYIGSLTVNGHVPNQFALDVHNGTLRVATSEFAYKYDDGEPELLRTQHVYTMTATGSTLSSIGSLSDFALDENIRSARFVGDRGYIVTFLNTDPLFVLDLADPKKPAVLGELKISGFSEYLHPIDQNHLLTIGREADTSTGVITGLSVQLFDVTTPTAPKLVNKDVFQGDAEAVFSDAEVDHKAFAYDAASKTLSFPLTHITDESIHAVLQVYDVDATKGVSRRGSVNHDVYFSRASWGPCVSLLSSSIRRGVFLGGNLYAVSNAAVTAHSQALAPLGSVALQDASVLAFKCASEP